MIELSPDVELASDEGEDLLWASFKKNGSAPARERLFLRHSPFAQNIARRHYREQSRGDIELADLVQLAYAGLLEALDRFELQYGTPFRAFAAHRISGSIRDGIVRMNEVREQMSWRNRVRRERVDSLANIPADQMGTSDAMAKMAEIAVGLALGFMLEGTGLFEHGESNDGVAHSKTGYESLAWKEIVDQLHIELSALPEREHAILRQHYIDGMSFDHLAALLAVSKGRISQLHRGALNRLRKRMRERGHFKLER